MQRRIQIQKLPTIVNSFRIVILSGKTPKNMLFAIENLNTETAFNYKHISYLILSGNTQKNMGFTMEETNTETVYNCSLFPYFKFKWKNSLKHAFCNGRHEYENCLQL